jgi:glycosyltransferase involved in cell wall biosynthesis
MAEGFPMHFLMIVHNVVGKGTYWRALHLARALAKREHEITIVATSRDHHFRTRISFDSQTGVRIIESPDLFKGPLRSGWDLWNSLSRIIQTYRLKVDLVHAFESRPVVILPALFWQRWQRVPLVMDWSDWFGRGGAVEERPNQLLRAFLRPVETFFEEYFRAWADGTTVINSFLYQRAVNLRIDPNYILLLPNGCNIDEIFPVSQLEARKTLGWPEDIYILGYIGTIFRADAELMAQSFEILYRMEPRSRLLIIGYCNIAVETMVKASGVVWRTGWVDYRDLNLYLGACDVCWLPMRNSGANWGRSPLKLNDYMAAGRPVVITNVGDVAKLVAKGNFGLVVDDNPEDLAKAVFRLLKDPSLCKEMGRRARYLAESEFAWDFIAAKLLLFYNKVRRRYGFNT